MRKSVSTGLVCIVFFIVFGNGLTQTLADDMVEKLKRFNSSLKADQLFNAQLLMEECSKLFSDRRQLAYVLSTALGDTELRPMKEEKATSGTLVQIQEEYWHTGYYSRGYFLLIGKDEYSVFGKLIGIDIVNNPELLMAPSVAAKVLCVGMKKGLITGNRLDTFINDQKSDWVGARKAVFGEYKSQQFADVAQRIYNA